MKLCESLFFFFFCPLLPTPFICSLFFFFSGKCGGGDYVVDEGQF